MEAILQRYRRRRRQNYTFTLFITNFLGWCIGFSMCFALFMAGVFDRFIEEKVVEENRVHVAEGGAESLTPANAEPSTPVTAASEPKQASPDTSRVVAARADEREPEPEEEKTPLSSSVVMPAEKPASASTPP